MAAVGWKNEPYFCLAQVARRRVRAFITDFIIEEYNRVATEMEAEKIFRRSPWPTLNWFVSMCRHVPPALLGKPRFRDIKDDPYLACALSAQADFIVSRDQDLLEMGKPFGIEILTPRSLLSRLAR